MGPSTPEPEGLRDLLRCRDDLRCARTAARHRVAKTLLRHGRIYRDGPEGLDGRLKGFPDSIEAVFPQTWMPTCTVHLIRTSLHYVNDRDKRTVAKALRPIYAANADDALAELERFEAEWGARSHDAVELSECGELVVHGADHEGDHRRTDRPVVERKRVGDAVEDSDWHVGPGGVPLYAGAQVRLGLHGRDAGSLAGSRESSRRHRRRRRARGRSTPPAAPAGARSAPASRSGTSAAALRDHGARNAGGSSAGGRTARRGAPDRPSGPAFCDFDLPEAAIEISPLSISRQPFNSPGPRRAVVPTSSSAQLMEFIQTSAVALLSRGPRSVPRGLLLAGRSGGDHLARALGRQPQRERGRVDHQAHDGGD